MLKVVIVDDEELSLFRLKDILNHIGNVEVIGTYTNGAQAVEAIAEVKPNLIFLDINLPGEFGIEIAQKVQMMDKDIQIVFVTAHEKYALKAFEIGVLDYVLKPYNKKRIKQVINKVEVSVKVNKNEFTIHAFKYFHIKLNGTEIKNIKWRTAKSRELLSYLIQHSEGIIRKDILIEIFWPEVGLKSAYDNLYTTIYQLRKVITDLGMDLKILNATHGYEIEFSEVKYDVKEWMSILKEIELNLWDLTDNSFYKVMEQYSKLKTFYKGHYLAEESCLWKENLQEQYMIMFFSVSQKVIEALEERELYAEAILNALHLQRLYPYQDYSYFLLMRLYGSVGDRYNVERHYENLKEMLENEFGTTPNNQIKEWYKEWISAQYMV